MAADWDVILALSRGDAYEIQAAQERRGRIDITARVFPDLGLIGISQLISNTLKESAELSLDHDESGSFVMIASAVSLQSALLLALCDARAAEPELFILPLAAILFSGKHVVAWLAARKVCGPEGEALPRRRRHHPDGA